MSMSTDMQLSLFHYWIDQSIFFLHLQIFRIMRISMPQYNWNTKSISLSIPSLRWFSLRIVYGRSAGVCATTCFGSIWSLISEERSVLGASGTFNGEAKPEYAGNSGWLMWSSKGTKGLSNDSEKLGCNTSFTVFSVGGSAVFLIWSIWFCLTPLSFVLN